MPLAAALITLLSAPRSARAGLDTDETLFTDHALGLSLSIPDGWRATTQTGYPELLLLLQAPAGSARVVLSGGPLAPANDLARFVAGNLAGMRAVGMQVVRSQRILLHGIPVWEVVALANRDQEIRQLYVPHRDRVFTLTLCGPRSEVARLQSDFSRLLTELRLD